MTDCFNITQVSTFKCHLLQEPSRLTIIYCSLLLTVTSHYFITSIALRTTWNYLLYWFSCLLLYISPPNLKVSSMKAGTQFIVSISSRYIFLAKEPQFYLDFRDETCRLSRQRGIRYFSDKGEQHFQPRRWMVTDLDQLWMVSTSSASNWFRRSNFMVLSYKVK